MKSLIKPRVVIDTNVFISGLFFGGNPRKILDLWLKKRILVFISPGILAEIILLLKEFLTDNHQVKRFKELIENNCLRVIPEKKVSLCKDKKDNKFLELVYQVKADYLITGDKKHLVVLKEFKGTKIVLPKQFLEENSILDKNAS